jgi:hypothetical protein
MNRTRYRLLCLTILTALVAGIALQSAPEWVWLVLLVGGIACCAEVARHAGDFGRLVRGLRRCG